ncbi:hypothetical protein Pelo_18611 [Pelomyxa schiedti]|nr:hypothetical protein Pelo_18611 [Pelomyxa schiedti]
MIVACNVGIPWYGGGFIGVDVLFVTAGYTVFGPAVQALLSDSFSALEFLFTQMKRTALPVAVNLTALVSMLLIFRSAGEECSCFADTAATSLRFTNIRFFLSGFSTDSPVFHYWAVSLEEQLYLVLPLVMIACRSVLPPRLLKKLLIPAICISSAVLLALFFVQTHEWKFFLPTSRIWEFAAGALVHHLHCTNDGDGDGDGGDEEDKRRQRKHRFYWIESILKSSQLYLACVAAAIVIGLGAVASMSNYPNFVTAGVVFLTAYLLWCKFDNKSLVGTVTSILGRMSFSFYIYHYPCIQLMKIFDRVYGLATTVVVPALTLTVLLSTLSYKGVEQRVQRNKWSKKQIAGVFFLGIVIPLFLSVLGNGGSLTAAHPPSYATRIAAAASSSSSSSISSSSSSQSSSYSLSSSSSSSPPPQHETIIPWHYNITNNRSKTLFNELGKVGWAFYNYPDYENAWRMVRNRSTEVGIALVGDSQAMQWWRHVDHYAAEVGASSMLAAHSTKFGKNFYWYGGAATRMVIPKLFGNYKHMVIVVCGLIGINVTASTSFQDVIRFWRKAGPVVILSATPWHRLNPNLCIKSFTNLTACHVPVHNMTPAMDIKLFDYFSKNGTFDGNITVMSMRDIGCWMVSAIQM